MLSRTVRKFIAGFMVGTGGGGGDGQGLPQRQGMAVAAQYSGRPPKIARPLSGLRRFPKTSGTP